MAKSKTNNTKPKTSIFLCCFGSTLPNNKEGYDPLPKQKKTSWFSWRRIRINMKSTPKTVPFEASVPYKAHSSKFRSKSTLHHNKSQIPATTPPPPTQPLLELSATPYYTPSQTRHGATSNNVQDTRQQGRASPKRQIRRLSSSMQNQTTIKKAKNARNPYDPVVGMSVLVVTLVIMIFWGRLCAILCTSAWLYFIPRFSKIVTINDDDTKTKLNDVDLDSEVYKKKVIMEGILGRNHR